MRLRVSPWRALLLIGAASVPALLFMNVWQGVRYTRLRDEVHRLEEEQIAWYERNKNLLAAIGIYSSPKRLEAVAAQDPGTRKAAPKEAVRVQVEPDGSSSSSDTGKGP